MNRNFYKKRYIFTFFFVLIVIFAFLSYFYKGEDQKYRMNKISASLLKNGTEKDHFSLLVAQSDEERRRGLSILSDMKRNEGMLFVFPSESFHNFWMKGMKFPIDIFWIRSDGSVCFIKRNAVPEEYPETYKPDCKSRYVIELKAGVAEEDQIEKGDMFLFREE